MTTAIASNNTLKLMCDRLFANTGTIGQIALLKGDLTTNLSVSASAATDIFTTPSPHGLLTGSRVRIASTGTVPTPSVAGTDYYAIVLSASTFKLATTLANAQASTSLDLVDSGSAAITMNEQELNSEDPMNVLLAKELTHPAWSNRLPVAALGAASFVSPAAEKPLTTVIANTNATPLSYKHVLYLGGAGVGNAIGSTPTGLVEMILATEATAQIIAQGETKALTFKFKVSP